MPQDPEIDNSSKQRVSRFVALLLLVLMLAPLIASACNQVDQEAVDASTTKPAVPRPESLPTDSLIREQIIVGQHLPATFTPEPTLTSTTNVTPEPLPPPATVSMGQLSGLHNRLTGEVATDPHLLERRPLAVKISNAPAKWTRPQAGLSQADLVYEHLTEGSITRFTAIFYGNSPPKLGPIRSARLIDLQLPAMYDAALVYSGSSIGVSRLLFDSNFRGRILRTNTPGYYRTGENKPYEHTLYANPEKLWETLSERGENQLPVFGSAMAFNLVTPSGGAAAAALTVRYDNFTTVEWRFDPAAGHYLRWADGEKHMDANNDEQISANNVVVLLVPHVLDETICEYQSGDRCLAHSMEIQLWGEGQAVLLRDGMAFDVTWSRQQRHELLTFVDDNRQPFPLQLGNTWFQVVPPSTPGAYSVDP